jgi:hypothetical protein
VEPVDTNIRVVWSFAACNPSVCRFDIGTPVISSHDALVGDPLLENRAVNAKSQ